MVVVVVGHNLQLRVLSHSTCESLMEGCLEEGCVCVCVWGGGLIGLMRLAEEHSLVGWLVTPDRAHRNQQHRDLMAH